MGGGGWPGCRGGSRRTLAVLSSADNEMSFDVGQKAGALGWSGKSVMGGAPATVGIAGTFHPPRNTKFAAIAGGRGAVQTKEVAKAGFEL
jgi:hypothetical protein